jgi:cell division control protein 6
MSIFEEIMDNDNSVFRNQEIFNINYFPELVQCRDKELKSILINIKPLLSNNKVLNTIIMGNTSTGKTTVIKHALLEIEQYTDIKTCYLNCNIQNTARKCYFQMFKVLFGHNPRNNVSTEIIQEELMEKLEEESFILVIDDMNYLSKQDSNKLINELLRANEFYHSNLAIIIIVNNISFKYSLEKNAQSVLQCNEVEFKDYTVNEMYSILKCRCELGFKKGVITDEQIMKISENAVNYTNLRWGLTTLNLLGQKVESENRDKIENEDLKKYLIVC